MNKCKSCGQDLPNEEKKAEQFVLAGYTKRRNGFNYFHTIQIGAPIYRFKNQLYVYQVGKIDGHIEPVVYGLDKFEEL